MSLPVLSERDNAKCYSQPMTGESNQERMTAQKGGQGVHKHIFSYVNLPQAFLPQSKQFRAVFFKNTVESVRIQILDEILLKKKKAGGRNQTEIEAPSLNEKRGTSDTGSTIISMDSPYAVLNSCQHHALYSISFPLYTIKIL